MKIPFCITSTIDDEKTETKAKILETKNKIDELNRELSFQKSCLKAHVKALDEIKEFETLMLDKYK